MHYDDGDIGTLELSKENCKFLTLNASTIVRHMSLMINSDEIVRDIFKHFGNK